MEKGRPLLRWAGILLVGAAVSFVGIEAQGENGPVKAPAPLQAPVQVKAPAPAPVRPDRIKIDPLAAFGKLELPAVTFFHDKHTDVLLKEKKNCETCHLVENHKLSPAFKRQQKTPPAKFKDIYHANCIGCHTEMAGAGKKSGPLDGFCRSCHDAKPQIAAARLGAGLDKVLHFRHADSKSIPLYPSEKDNCGQCHHAYDKQAKKIFYAKGQEETCRDCHLDKPKDGVKSMEQAAHQECVLCHLDLANKGVKETGPYVCDGCHGAKGQALVAKKNQEAVAKLPNHEVPRLLRGQPNAALITYDPKVEAGKGEKPFLMNPVAFDHKAHEKYNDSCRVCHHASMDPCEQCHTLAGAKEGGFVTFDQAMHLKNSQQSCLGCHAAQQAAKDCAGCHNHLEKTRRSDDAACRQCHLQLPEPILPGGAARRDNAARLTDLQKTSFAEIMLKGRTMNPRTYAIDDIPEKVVIKELADKFEPSEFSHRKHVVALMKGMKDSPLAGYYHRDPGTICQGCHHYSPAAQEPPGCGNCHAKRFDATKQPERPGLLAAMHDQCMACHKDMALEKPAATACTECHQKKKK